jgi:hypothetical protein
LSNLREYLEQCKHPEDGYWNLYTAPHNRDKQQQERGWSKSPQRGKGALGLVFTRRVLTSIFKQDYFVDQPWAVKGWNRVDGVISTSANNLGLFEYVHSPTLIYHNCPKDCVSSLGHGKFPEAKDFLGETFDARTFLHE